MVEKWKPGQLAAINWEGGELIVSASAGTGKTSVIVERAWQLVIGGGANVDELLIVTFTEDAAEQLKSRFRARLDRETAAAERRETRAFLRDQLHRLDKAQISTIHSFCYRVVRENYHRLGIGSEINVLPPEQAALIKQQVLDELLENSYADEGEFGMRFRRVVERYGGRRVDEALGETILAIHSFLGSLARPEAWLERVRQLSCRYRAADFSMTELAVWKVFKDAWLTRLAGIYDGLNRSKERIAERGHDKLTSYLDALLEVTENSRRQLGQDRFDATVDPLPKSPPVRKDSPENEWWAPVREQVDSVKEGLKEWRAEMEMALSPESKNVLAEHGEYLETILELVGRFSRRLRDTKEIDDGLEFDDLQRLALEVLVAKEENDKRAEQAPPLRPSAVAESYRQKFKYILVDEYQDINELQDRLLRLVGRGANLFMVGDVKQSIYRFRLAEPEIFQRLCRSAQSGGTGGPGRIDLPDNFRSRREVIDSVNAIFTPVWRGGELELEYDTGSRLIYASAFPATRSDPTTEMHLLERKVETQTDETDQDTEVAEMELAEREAFVVARRIRELLDRGFQIAPGGSIRPAQPEDIVILLRSLRSVAGTYISMLRRFGLNAYCEHIEAFLEYPEIADIVSLLKIIDNPFQDIALAAVLRSGLVEADLTDLAKIRMADRGHLFSALTKLIRENPQDLSTRKLVQFMDRLERWRRMAGCTSVAELVQDIFLTTSYPDYVRASLPGRSGGENLDQFLELAWRFSRDGRCDLSYFLNYLDLTGEQTLPISDVRGGPRKGVRLQTIHAAKGLEYPVVVLGGLGRQVNLMDIRRDILIDRELLIGAKDVDLVTMSKTETLPFVVIAQSIRHKAIAEELRLLYVALTRAKEKLILVGSASLAQLLKGLQPISPGEKLTPNQVADWDTPIGWIGSALASSDEGEKWLSLLSAERQEKTTCGPFQITVYPGPTQAKWAVEGGFFSKVAPEVMTYLQTLIDGRKKHQAAVPATAKQAVEKIMDRLAWRYPHEELVTMPTSVSVTQLVEQAQPATTTLEKADPFTFLDARTGQALEKGRAWHSFLEHLDLRQPLTEENLRRQLEDMVTQKLIPTPHATLIDMEKVRRFFKTQPGRIMLENRDRLYRELRFTYSLAARNFPKAAGLADSEEPVLVQGVVDCLAQTSDGFVIIDYKTNAIGPADVDRMREHYRIQLDLYAKAIGEIVRARIASAWLYFTEPDSAVQVL